MRSALIVSPFASAPRDAGHRRRVWQMTRALADAGFRITFLLAAFEDAWAWRHDEAGLAALQAEWDEVVVAYCGDQVGRPPCDGVRHRLDEWWDPAVEQALVNLHLRRFFDVVVVHNVWLSKAFDFVHRASVKVLETHDLFWRRTDAFAAIGVPPSFFLIDRDSEIFGINRADIAVTIQEKEARELLALTPRRVVNVPYYDPTLECDPPPAALRDERVVSFGCLGSAHPFNTQGLDALLAALEEQVAESFAPVEIVVGGSVGAAARTRLPIKRVGAVASEAAFYAGVDYAIAPVFAGTGFKVKTADALALGTPLIASTHAAEGVALERGLVCESAQDMAARMVEISLSRPDPRSAQAQVLRARDDLRARTGAGVASLIRAIDYAADAVVIDLHDATLASDALKLHAWFGALRGLAARTRVLLLLPPDLRALAGPVLPPGAAAMDLAAFTVQRDRYPRHCFIDATASGARRARHCRDDRWDADADPPAFAVPAAHPDGAWEGAAVRLRRAWQAALPPRLPPLDGMRVLCTAALIAPRMMPPGLTVIDAADRAGLESMLMRLLCGARPREVVLGGDLGARQRSLVLDICTVAGVPVHGRIDDAALAPGALPVRAAEDIRRRSESALAALTRQEGA